MEGFIKPLIKGTILTQISKGYTSDKLKIFTINGALIIIANEINIPLKIDTIQAVLIKSSMFSLTCIKKIFIPVSVAISKKESTNAAMPNIPNCEGVRSLASIAILKNPSPLISTLKVPIHETPFIASFIYPT